MLVCPLQLAGIALHLQGLDLPGTSQDQAGRLGGRLLLCDCLIHDVVEVEHVSLQPGSLPLQPGQIENLLDEIAQARGLPGGLFQIMGFLLGLAVVHQFQIQRQACHRRAQLMRYVRHELALEPIQFLQAIIRRAQLARPLKNALLQFFVMPLSFSIEACVLHRNRRLSGKDPECRSRCLVVEVGHSRVHFQHAEDPAM